MTKTEDNPDMRVLKTATCKTLSGKSTLTFQIGAMPDSTIHLRISKNSGGGFFSDEWVSLDDILRVLKDRPRESPVMSHFLTRILKGKSANTSGFILAMLTHLKLSRPLPKKKRVHELLDPGPFLEMVEKLMSTGDVKTVRKTTKKTTARKAPSKKAAVKKRAMAKKKSTRKESPARS